MKPRPYSPALVGTGEILPAHTLDLLPGKVRIVIHEKIDVAGDDDDTITKLMERARVAIESGFDG